MINRVQCRRGRLGEWALINPILALGEFAYETDTKRLKIGDGTTKYNDQPYFGEGQLVYHSTNLDGNGTAISPLDLSVTGVNPGTYGDSTKVPILTVDKFGRITSASSTNSIASGSVTQVDIKSPTDLAVSGSPITSSGTISIDLTQTGVTADKYGADRQIPILTVDSKGRITLASTSSKVLLEVVARDSTTLAGDGTAASPLRVIGGVGTQGEQGYQGRQGYQGYQGRQGNQGEQGYQGRQGNQGNQGSQGYQGYQGNQGYLGEQGNQGEQGYQGNQGEIGSGLAIKGFATWEDIFNNKTGTSLTGDLWIVTDVSQGTATQPCPDPLIGTAAIGDGLVYNDISPVYWTNGGSLKGPIGEQGSQGEQGRQGEQGSQGEQ